MGEIGEIGVSGETRKVVLQCELCSKEKAVYTCPSCSRRTCSLACCQEHKRKFSCTGKRCRVKDLRIQNFTDADLHSDYKLLVDAQYVVESTARRFLEPKTVFASKDDSALEEARAPSKSKRLPAGKQYIQLRPRDPAETNGVLSSSSLVAAPDGGRNDRTAEIKKHCKNAHITFRSAPPQLAIRRINTTTVSKKSRRIQWMLSFIIWPHEPGYLLSHISEELTLNAALGRFAKLIVEQPNRPEFDFDSDYIVLLRDCSKPESQPLFFQLVKESKMVDNLKGKTVVEFPELVLVARKDVSKFEIVEFVPSLEIGT